MLNVKRMFDESAVVGTLARYLFLGIYAGDRHGHDDGAAASDKFNGRLQDTTVNIARALYSTG
jgi:hypothetical protein